MSDMKCPFCNQELRKISATSFFVCDSCNITGFDKLWQELIRTRKALDKAKSVLEDFRDYAELDGIQECDVIEALDEIKTALEQKDVK
jgi:transposase-like protein